MRFGEANGIENKFFQLEFFIDLMPGESNLKILGTRFQIADIMAREGYLSF